VLHHIPAAIGLQTIAISAGKISQQRRSAAPQTLAGDHDCVAVSLGCLVRCSRSARQRFGDQRITLGNPIDRAFSLVKAHSAARRLRPESQSTLGRDQIMQSAILLPRSEAS
jgi:hypothetical protein